MVLLAQRVGRNEIMNVETLCKLQKLRILTIVPSFAVWPAPDAVKYRVSEPGRGAVR